MVTVVKALLRAAAMRDPTRHNSASLKLQKRVFPSYGGAGGSLGPDHPPAVYN